MTQQVKKKKKIPPAMQETQVPSLGWEDPFQKETTNPLQYSCLENPMDRGPWLAMAHRVARVEHLGHTCQKRGKWQGFGELCQKGDKDPDIFALL